MTLITKQPSGISVLTFAIAIFCFISISPAFGSVSSDLNYECAGKVDNGMVTFREFPAFRFSGQRLKISGSDIFSTYNFEVCSENVALLSFATSQKECLSHTSSAANNSLKSAYGTLDKNSGKIDIAGSQGLHGEYQCKASIKK